LQQQLIANAEVARDQRQREEDKKLDELNKLQAKNPYGKREQPKPKNQVRLLMSNDQKVTSLILVLCLTVEAIYVKTFVERKSSRQTASPIIS
jgi:hypothetical protein